MDEKYSFLNLIDNQQLLQKPKLGSMAQELQKMGMQINEDVGLNLEAHLLSKINLEQFDLESLEFKQTALRKLNINTDFVKLLSGEALDYIYSKIDESDVPIHQTFLYHIITSNTWLSLSDQQLADLIEKTAKSKVNPERHYGEDSLIQFSLFPLNHTKSIKDEHLIKIISFTNFKTIKGIQSRSVYYLSEIKKKSSKWSAGVKDALGKKIISDNMAQDKLDSLLTLVFKSLGLNYGSANNKNIHADNLLCSIWEHGGQNEYILEIIDKRLRQEGSEKTLVLPNYSAIREKYILDKILGKKQTQNNLISKI